VGIAKGRPWGEPTGAAADLVVEGGDAQLAAAAAAHPGALVEYRPARSDLAAALGLGGAHQGLALPLDLVAIEGGPPVANMLVIGTPPAAVRAWTPARPVRVEVDGRELFTGPATTVVVANGQFLEGRDLVPRGHPGDGRLEVQVYALRRGERRAMRARLPQGAHLPHPRIVTATARRFTVTSGGAPLAWAADGCPGAPRSRLAGAVQPGALRILL
jgi:hypothetical protein